MTYTSNSNDTKFKTKELRYLARSVGILALLTGLIYLRVLGLETIASLQAKQGFGPVVILLGLLVVAMAGLLCGWRWELVGGLTAVISAVGIFIIAYFNTSQYPLFAAAAYSSPFFVAGGLMLACWQRNQR